MRLAALVPMLVCFGCAAKPTPSLHPGPLPAELRARQPAPEAVAVPPRAGGGAQADAAGRILTLPDALARANTDSWAVLRAERRLETVDQRRREQQGALGPMLELRGAAGYQTGRTLGNFGDVANATFWRFDPSVALVYRLNPGAQSKAASALSHDRAAAEHDIEEARRQAKLAVAHAWHDVALAQSAVGVSDLLAVDAARFLEIAQARADAEVASGADVALAKAELAKANGAAVVARGQWEAASATLATLLRYDPGALLRTPDPKPVAVVELDSTAALAGEAGQARPDVAAARQRIAAADARHKAAKYDVFVPDVGLEVRERFIGTGPSNFGPGTQAQAFVGWTFTLAEIGRVRAAKAEREEAEFEVTAAREQAVGQVHAAAARARAARESIDAAHDVLTSTERHYEIQLARFEAGSALGLEVIAAQNEVARARLSLQATVVRFNRAQAEILAAIGHLDAASVGG